MENETHLKKKVQLTVQTSSPIEIPLRQNSDDSCIGSISPSKNSIGTQTPVEKLNFDYPPLAVLDDDDVFTEDSLLNLVGDEKQSPKLHSTNSFRGIGEKLFSGWFRSRGETQEQHLGHRQFITRSRSLSCSYEGSSKAIGRQLRDIADDLDRQILRASSSSRSRRTVRSHSLREQY